MSEVVERSTLLDPGRWNERLAEESRLFAPLARGSRIGVVAEALVASATPRATRMLVWQSGEDGMRAGTEPYPGFDTVDVDLLIAVDETADRALADAAAGAWCKSIRALLRDGHVLFFARRPRAALEDAGYEDLLYELGFAYLGACR